MELILLWNWHTNFSVGNIVSFDISSSFEDALWKWLRINFCFGRIRLRLIKILNKFILVKLIKLHHWFCYTLCSRNSQKLPSGKYTCGYLSSPAWLLASPHSPLSLRGQWDQDYPLALSVISKTCLSTVRRKWMILALPFGPGFCLFLLAFFLPHLCDLSKGGQQ